MIASDHIIIGVALGLATGTNNPELITIAVIGSFWPDLDVIFARPATLNYLLKHRTISHGLIFAPLIALLVAAIFNFIFVNYNFWYLFLICFSGSISHLIVDVFNSFGTMVFYPFSRKRISLDLIYEFDPAISLIFLVICFEFYFLEDNISAGLLLLNLFLIFSYYCYRYLSKILFLRKIEKTYPSLIFNKIVIAPAKYWRWKGIVCQGDFHYIFRSIKGEIVLEKRPIVKIPKKFICKETMIYKEYSRFLDVKVKKSKIILQNLIYPPSVYEFQMEINDVGESKISISIPNAKFNDY